MRRILLVDDEPVILAGIAELLRMQGFEVRCVETGVAVLPAIQEFSPEAVILDLTLPDVSGIDVYRSIRENWNLLPVIFATGHVRDERLRPLAFDKRAAVLEKPFDFETLMGKLRELA